MELSMGGVEAEMSLQDDAVVPEHVQTDLLSEDEYSTVLSALELRSVDELAKGVMTIDRILPVLKSMIAKVYLIIINIYYRYNSVGVVSGLRNDLSTHLM